MDASETKILAETERYAVWSSYEKEEDTILYHLELGNVTYHFFPDEWEELVKLILEAVR